MATKVHMEALSPTMEEGQLVRWLKSEGDDVAEGDVLAEIETDKATMELVARGSGVLRTQLVREGQTAPVGSLIGVVAGADEDISGIVGEAPAGAGEPTHAPPGRPEPGEAEEEEEGEAAESAGAIAAADKSERPQAATGVEAAAESPRREPTPAPAREPRQREEGQREEGQREERGAGVRIAASAAPPAPPPGDGRTKASPLARRLAAEAGVELRQVRGTGPGGRIVKRDIEGALGRAEAPAVPERAAAPAAEPGREAAAGRQPAPAGRPAAEAEEVPVSQMRKAIAKRLVTSIGPVPTFYLTIEADMARLLELREAVNARLAERNEKASINDFLIKAVAAALVRHPEVNASWGETVIRRHRSAHIGVAVAIEDGLITPVVRDADRKGVAEIAREVRELAGRAREKKLAPEEYTGATFSISNLGMLGIEEFTAIINPPEAAILAVGRVEEKVVADAGEVVVRPRMRMTMSCDHRVIDGATGARFLQTLREFLEEPMMMLV